MGTLGIYSILTTNPQNFFVKDATKYCFIPSVPSGLEELKTRPELLFRFLLCLLDNTQQPVVRNVFMFIQTFPPIRRHLKSPNHHDTLLK